MSSKLANVMASVVMLMVAALLGAGELRAEGISAELRAEIDTNTRMAVERFSRQSGRAFDYSVDSVAWLAAFIERNRRQDPGRMAEVIGAYLGEAMVQTYDGRWVSIDGVPAVELADGFVAFPVARVQSNFRNGPDDSILTYFKAIPEMLAEWQAERRGQALR